MALATGLGASSSISSCIVLLASSCVEARATADEADDDGGGTSPGIKWFPTVGETGARESPVDESGSEAVDAPGWMGVDERGCKW